MPNELKADYRELCWTDLEIKATDGAPESRVVSFVASTESLDSHGEIVEQDWILDRFSKNPAVLFNHNKHAKTGMLGGSPINPEHILPIGKAVKWGVDAQTKSLKIDVEFAPAELNTFADQVYRNVKAGFIKGGSVGFKPHDVQSEKAAGDKKRYRLRRNELYEFSIVPMGSNADSVSLSAEDEERHCAYLDSIEQKAKAPMDMTCPACSKKTPADGKTCEHCGEPLPKETPQMMPKTVENAAEVPVPAGVDVEKLKALELETNGLREKLALREKADGEREVDALIGKSIVPVQRADFLELRMLSSDLFARITKALPDLKLAEPAIKPEPIDVTETKDIAETPGARAARKLAPGTEK